MTEQKLTARLSDGTEWEVVEKWTADGPGCVRCSLKPLKPSPPKAPKEVWVSFFRDGTPLNVESVYYGDSYRRYILAPEHEPKKSAIVEEIEKLRARRNELYSKMDAINAETERCIKTQDKKPAREWWIARWSENGTRWAGEKTFSSQFDASRWSMGCPYAVEVVHVREVV